MTHLHKFFLCMKEISQLIFTVSGNGILGKLTKKNLGAKAQQSLSVDMLVINNYSPKWR